MDVVVLIFVAAQLWPIKVQLTLLDATIADVVFVIVDVVMFVNVVVVALLIVADHTIFSCGQ